MKEVIVRFSTENRYEYDEEDPNFKGLSEEQIKGLLKYMLFVDLFQGTPEEDILRLIQVEILD